MGSRVEALDRARKVLLAFLALAFFALEAFSAAGSVLQSWGRYTGTTDIVTSSLVENRPAYFILALVTVGLALLSAALWIVLQAYLSRKPDLRSAVNNELVKQNWLKAFRIGFLSLAVAVVGETIAIFFVQVVTGLFHLPQVADFWTTLLPKLYVLIGTVGLFGSFLYYDRERNHDAAEA